MRQQQAGAVAISSRESEMFSKCKRERDMKREWER